jgi:hypothetical protein
MKNISKYTEFINESKIIELIMESKVVFSKRFINLLSKMQGNKIAKELLNIYSKDLNVQHNYIDITDTKDEVSFTPDRKVQEIIADRPEVYEITGTRRQLPHKEANEKIFKILGYDSNGVDYWQPNTSQRGLIKAETISALTGKVYTLFEELTDSETKRVAVLNKDCLKLSDFDDSQIWKTSRNPIRIGRLVRPLLRSAGITVIDKEVEDFTNQWKATYDFMADGLKQFDIVKGDSIAYWYDKENYLRGGGTLNNSCMSGVESDYFDIYTSNRNVSLVILYDDSGQIQDDKYTSTKIKGRAILWDAEIIQAISHHGKDVKFMDRIYTTNDSDVELFKQYAKKEGWYWKTDQSMEPDEEITNGQYRSSAEIRVYLNGSEFDHYPYLDTMCFLYTDEDFLTNVDMDRSDMRVLRSTEGNWFHSF